MLRAVYLEDLLHHLLKTDFLTGEKGKEKITMHENSTNHKSCVLLMRERGKILNRVDKQLTQQVEIEISYWRNVLRRVIAVVKSLSSRELPFRGRNHHFGSSQNGNFMMSLELISEFDPFLANHIKEFGNKKKVLPPTYPLRFTKNLLTLWLRKL